MKQASYLFTTTPSKQTARIARRITPFHRFRCRLPCEKLRQKSTGKELDRETGLYYFGARYFDPRTSRWLSPDPAIWEGDYFPIASNSRQARRHNQNLPGEGGFFNTINLHVYHYAANNPIRYIDPDGRNFFNRTEEVMVVRTEGGQHMPVLPGEMYEGKIDGAISQDGTVFKVSDINIGPRVKLDVRRINSQNRGFIVGGLAIRWNNFLDRIKGRDKLLSGVYEEGKGGSDMDSWRRRSGRYFNSTPDEIKDMDRPGVRDITPRDESRINNRRNQELAERQ